MIQAPRREFQAENQDFKGREGGRQVGNYSGFGMEIRCPERLGHEQKQRVRYGFGRSMI